MESPTLTTQSWWRRLPSLAGRLLIYFLLLHAFAFALFDLLPDAAISRVGIFAADPAILRATREKMHLRGRWFERYWQSLKNVISGNLGNSLQGNYPISKLFHDRFIASLPLLAISLCVTLLCSLFASIIFMRRQLHARLRAALWFAHAGLIPPFLAAGALSFIWVWFGDRLGASSETFRFSCACLASAALPATTLFIATANTAHEIARQPFTVTYEAIGATPMVIWRCLFKNVAYAIRPLGGRLALATLTGTLFAEYAFDQKGIGMLLADSLKASDFPVAFAWLIFSGMATLCVSLTFGNKDD